jgi:DNA-binding GntR family transcriptional regulator
MSVKQSQVPSNGSANNAGHGRLTSTAYEHIRSGILAQRLAAGTVLNETKLAASLGMSKTPIRQALRALFQEGLLDTGPRRQVVVRNFTESNRAELIAVREALERIAVTAACDHMTVEDIDQLRIELRKQKRAVDSGSESEFIDRDEQMHLMIASSCQLTLVPRLLNDLRGFVRMQQLNTRREPGHELRVLAEHEALIDAIEAHDVDSALRALEYHLHTNDYPPEDDG